jgi:hypothetical protein
MKTFGLLSTIFLVEIIGGFGFFFIIGMSTRGGFGEVGVLGDLLQVSSFPETIERLKALLHY